MRQVVDPTRFGNVALEKIKNRKWRNYPSLRNAEYGMRNAEKVADVIIDIQIRRQGHVRYATA